MDVKSKQCITRGDDDASEVTFFPFLPPSPFPFFSPPHHSRGDDGCRDIGDAIALSTATKSIYGGRVIRLSLFASQCTRA